MAWRGEGSLLIPSVKSWKEKRDWEERLKMKGGNTFASKE